MLHVQEYIVAFIIILESPKTDIPQCAPSAQSPASRYHARSGSLASTNTPSDFCRNIVTLMMIDQRWPPPLLASLQPLPPATAGVKRHLCLAIASPCSLRHRQMLPSPSNIPTTAAIEPHLQCPLPPPRTGQHCSLPCWEDMLPEVAPYVNTK